MNLDWLFTQRSAWILLLVSLITLVLYALLLPLVITRLPATYFLRPARHSKPLQQLSSRSPGRLLLLFLRNLLGFSLMLLGIALLVLPGQGLLTILVGLMLCNFPGKRRLLRWFVLKSKLARPLNHFREKHGRPPFQF